MLDKLIEMLGLPSPGTALAVLVAVAGAAGYGFHFGDRTGADRVEARYSHEKDAVVAAYRATADAAEKRAMAAEEQARRVADQNAAFQTALAPLLKDIRNGKTIPSTCVDDANRVRINAAVGTINTYGGAKATDPGGLSAKLPGATAPVGQPQRVDSGPFGIRWGVLPSAQ